MKTQDIVEIVIREEAGEFAESKDDARKWREEKILPALRAKQKIVLNFSGVEVATQSFIHALISSPLHEFGNQILKLIEFKGCNSSVKQIISTVVEYSLSLKS